MMSESGQFVLSICILLLAYYLTRRGHAWREKRAYLFILKDLKKKGALSAASAVDLPYAQDSIFGFGLRNYRKKAMEPLLTSDIVRQTNEGKYYLNRPEISDLNT